MSARIFLISDTHFGHKNALVFLRSDGVTPMRSFSSVEEMDETILARCAAVIRPGDHLYHLGDVTIPRSGLKTATRLPGKKRLVRGNHDIFRTHEYLEAGFEEIHGVRVFPKMGLILSHYPIHPGSLKPGWRNIHGHTHANSLGDPRYVNVSVEMTDYTPILLDDIASGKWDEPGRLTTTPIEG